MDYVNVNYVGLRLLPCLLGAALVPMAYVTMRNFGHTNITSIVTALMVLFENSLAAQSRLILLDSFLVFFTGFTALMWSEFLRWKNEPFSIQWWRTLTMVGVGLGLTVSIKWVGLFTITWIGINTLLQLWKYITNPTIPVKVFVRHFCARSIALIVVPICIYLFFFKIHFAVLNKTGPGAAFMPAEFQATLRGTPLVKTFEDVAYGSTVVIRHVNTGGGYLHSHPHSYPAGSKQQQITCYPHKDANSDFLIKHKLVFVNGSVPEEKPIEVFKTLVSGNIIRLEHTPTDKRLHSHDVRPGWNDDKEINEVSAYGSTGILGDANDHWIIETEDSKGGTPIKALSTVFRLKHQLTGCYLMSRSSKLPEWGFGQQEVTCSSKGRYALTLWKIESASHPEMPPNSKVVSYRHPSFLENVWTIHKVMFRSNNGLKSSHPYDSRPSQWPLLHRGISFWRSSPDTHGIYLIGNPFVWILSTVSVFIYLFYLVIQTILEKRNITFQQSGFFKDVMSGLWYHSLSYFCHFLPFFLMQRQLFLHHYLPSLYFSILCAGGLLDLVTFRLGKLQPYVVSGFAIVVIYVFKMFAPLTYGYPQDPKVCQSLKWRSKWDFSCPSIDAAQKK